MSELLQNDLLKYNKNQKYLVADFETANLNLISLENKPWQLGYLLATKDEILESHNIYIKWDKLNMSVDAARITGYDERIVEEKGIDPIIGLEKFNSLVYDPSIITVGHNWLNFDYAINNIWRRNLGLPTDYSYLERAFDTRALFSLYALKIPWDYKKSSYFQQIAALNYHKRGFKSNLAYCCKELGIKIEEEKWHSAEFDIVQTYFVFVDLLKKMDLK